MEKSLQSVQEFLCYQQRDIENLKKDSQSNYHICDLKNRKYELSEVLEICDIKGYSEEKAVTCELLGELVTLINNYKFDD